MEATQQFFAFLKDNWLIIKDLLAVIGGSATVLGAVLTILGIKASYQEARIQKHVKKKEHQETSKQQARDRAEWFAYVYRQKAPSWNTLDMNKMTVQQVCGLLGEDLPEWAVDGWERVLLSDMNKPVKKSA